MAEVLVAFLVEQLGSIFLQQVEQNVKLVVNVKSEVLNLTHNLETIQDVLADTERRQVKEVNVRCWLNSLKQVSFEIDDMLGKWSYEILKQQIEEKLCGDGNVLDINNNQKVCCFSFALHFQLCKSGLVSQIIFRHDIGKRIKDLNDKLTLIHDQRRLYEFHHSPVEMEQPTRLKNFSIVDKSGTFGRDCERDTLVSENSEEMNKSLVISILGLGGIGKTTLAQLAYNDDKVNDCFQKRIWVCVSEPFVQVTVAKAILEGLNANVPNSDELETYIQSIYNSIEGKKFLLVFDDV